MRVLQALFVIRSSFYVSFCLGSPLIEGSFARLEEPDRGKSAVMNPSAPRKRARGRKYDSGEDAGILPAKGRIRMVQITSGHLERD